MYLLILHEQQDRIFNSIQFTFHNVSINSIEETAQEASPDLIYIP